MFFNLSEINAKNKQSTLALYIIIRINKMKGWMI